MATGNPKLKWEVSSTYKERTVMWLAVSISRNVFMFGDSYPQFSLEANSKVHCSAKILLRHFRHFPLLANKQRCHSVSLKELSTQLFTQNPDQMRLLDLPTRLSVFWMKRYYKQHNNNMTLGHWINCVAHSIKETWSCVWMWDAETASVVASFPARFAKCWPRTLVRRR